MDSDLFFIVVILLIVAALTGAVAYGAVSLARRRRDVAEIDPGIGTVRRLYFYVVAFVALMMAASGVVEIGTFALDSIFAGSVIPLSPTPLAVGLSLVIVGLPLWAFHWRLIQRQAAKLPVETRSVVRRLYSHVVLGAAMSLALIGALGIVLFLLLVEPFSGYPWLIFAVWSAVWVFQWNVERKEEPTTPETLAIRRVYVYLFAGVLLVTGAIALALVVHTAFEDGYWAIAGAPLVSVEGITSEQTRRALALFIVASGGWALHWLWMARTDASSTLRQFYVHGLAAFGAATTIVVAVGLMLNGALQWTIGVPAEQDAWVHFGFLPEAATAMFVASLILAYHRIVTLRESAAAPEPRAGRSAYPYALAALGLALTAIAIGNLVDTLIAAGYSSPQRTLTGLDLWRNKLALTLTTALLGVPMWGYYWTRIQRRVQTARAEERLALARRVFIFGALGTGMLAVLGGSSGLIFVFFRELFDGDLSEVVRGARAALYALIPAGILLPYYWMVYQEDRRVTLIRSAKEIEAGPRKAVTVLIDANGAAFINALESALGYPVRPLRWMDPDAAHPELSEEALRELAGRINDAEGSEVIVVPDGRGARILSHR